MELTGGSCYNIRGRPDTVVLSDDDKYLPQGRHISGTGWMPGARSTEEKYLLVPHPFSDTFYTLRASHPEGYALHARCWDLIEHQIHPLASSCLDLIVAALERQWEYIIPQIWRERPFSGSLSGSYYGFVQHQEWVDDMVDSLFISEVDTLLQNSAQFLMGEASNESHRPLNFLTVKYSLPMEIKYLIADYLNNKDTSNMLVTFGEQFPVDYWNQQVPADIIFELEKAGPSTIH